MLKGVPDQKSRCKGDDFKKDDFSFRELEDVPCEVFEFRHVFLIFYYRIRIELLGYSSYEEGHL